MCGVLSYTRTEDVQTCKQKKNGDFWFHSSKKNIRLHIIETLIDIYNGNDHPDIVERVARKIRSIF